MGLLRFFLAISVVLDHSGPILGFSLVGGRLAVQSFYIISGFYIALILSEKYTGQNNSYFLFITNRFLRLFPVYWIVVALCILYSVALAFHSEGEQLGYFRLYADYFDKMHIGSFLLLAFTNLFLVLQDAVAFLGLDTITGHLFYTSNFRETNPMLFQFLFVPQAWTLGVEITFYLIAPFIVRLRLLVIAFIIMCSLLIRFFLYQHGLKQDPWSYRFFPSELVFFMLGVVAYRIYVRLRNGKVNAYLPPMLLAATLGFTFAYSFIPFDGKYFVYLALFFIALPFVFLLTKKWKNDAAVGELSYPIYISHMFLLTCMNTFGITKSLVSGISLTVVTVMFSVLLNELVAKKIESYRQERLKQQQSMIIVKRTAD